MQVGFKTLLQDRNREREQEISKILVFFFYLSQSKKGDDDVKHYTNLIICYLLFKYLFVLQILELRKR